MYADVPLCSCEIKSYIRDIELLVLSLQYKIALTVFLQKCTKRQILKYKYMAGYVIL